MASASDVPARAKALPLVSIIIPHFNGKEILSRCLDSLATTEYANKEIIVVDNASTDGSADEVRRAHPEIRLVRNRENRGYAGGCNSGLPSAHGEYLLFLNNDTEVEPNWLTNLIEFCEQDHRIAACQPKLLSGHNRAVFDYAGAAGGEIDIFGYPFARGRIFFTCERDDGQYDGGGDIFWASGAAIIVRKVALQRVGSFDEDFFAHMEEIDLNWRFHLAGYRVLAAPSARVYHNAGSTLQPDSPEKILLNHRNNLIMILKNYELKNLLWIFPIRIFFEILTLFYSLLKLDRLRAKAVVAALVFVAAHAKQIREKRRAVQSLRRIPDRRIFGKMYRGSILLAYFVRGIRRYQDLKINA
ncbi:MAG TPA: glycosyltransferase family 2 protein [bacterium]